ncbi:Receptor-like protein EIX2 [Glycine soja]
MEQCGFGHCMWKILECAALALLILISDVMGAIGPNCAVKNNSFECIEMERKALLKGIPTNIGALHHLESLDLSSNHISGPIPSNMASLTFLGHLNYLSYNNLSGEIPTANQFHTLTDPSIYEGNPHLCGTPLSIKCSEYDDENTTDEDLDSSHDKIWLYLSIGLGFIVGFWAVCGSLVLKEC